VLPKQYPLFYFTQLLLLLVSCVTILTTNKTLAFVSLLVQLNNKQSINLITSLCWSYFKTKLLPGYILPKYPSFSRSVTGYRDHSKPHSQADRTTERTSHHLALPLPLPLPQVRAQDNSNNKGNTTPVVVRTRMCRAYSTSPNLPRVHYRIQIKVPHGTVCTRRTRMDRPQYRPAGSTAPAVTHSNPLSLHPGAWLL
jgi:hypothetical protein